MECFDVLKLAIAHPDLPRWNEFGLVSPLSEACLRSSPHLVRWFLYSGANRDGLEQEPKTPLEHLMATETTPENLECLILLLGFGADPYVPDDQGLSAIDRAELEGDSKKLDLLRQPWPQGRVSGFPFGSGVGSVLTLTLGLVFRELARPFRGG